MTSFFPARRRCPHERAIRRDLSRTFPEHSFFKERDGVGQESLFNVLKAYSVHDKEVGYCQVSPSLASQPLFFFFFW